MALASNALQTRSRSAALGGHLRIVTQALRKLRASVGLELADLGAHPDSGETIQVKTGRYGPYVTDGTVNATVPKGTDPEKVDLDQAVELLAKREEKLRSQGKDPRAKKKTRRKKK